MAILFGASGAATSGTTSMSVAYPAGITAGQLLILYVVNKYPTNSPTTPSGWFLGGQASGGAGATGVDSGTVYATIFYTFATGAETGTLSITVTSGIVAFGQMSRYTHTTGNWSLALTTGSQNAANVSWSITGAANPGLTGDDVVLVLSGTNVAGQTTSVEALTATGCSFATALERVDSGTFTADHIGVFVSEHTVLTGNASAAPVYTATISGAVGSGPAGASVFLRIREVPGLPQNYQQLKVGDGMSTSEKIR